MTHTPKPMTDDQVDDLPPSAKYVFSIIKEDGPLGRVQIIDTVAPIYQERTIEDALKILREKDLVGTESCPHDSRETIYKLPEDESSYVK